MKIVMKKINLYLFFALVILSIGCKNDDESDATKTINKTALLVGTWILVETNDPQGAPNELVYTFEENGTFTYRITVQAGSRVESILDGTWRFADAEQTQVEITITESLLYTIDILNENTLQMSGDGVTIVMVKQ
jgi:hypothetical protein